MNINAVQVGDVGSDDNMKGDNTNSQERGLGTSGMIDRTELLRLMQQSLHKLGYADVARHLEEASVRDKPVPHASQHTFAYKNVMQIELIQSTRPDAPTD